MPTLKLLYQNASQRDLIIKLRFFGVGYNFVVDTGANSTCISNYLFNKIACASGLDESIYRSIETRKYHGVGGVEVSQRIPVKINFLGKILPAVTIGHFLDEWNNSKFSVEEHDGLLGQDVIRQFKQVVINYEKGEIQFNDK